MLILLLLLLFLLYWWRCFDCGSVAVTHTKPGYLYRMPSRHTHTHISHESNLRKSN